MLSRPCYEDVIYRKAKADKHLIPASDERQ